MNKPPEFVPQESVAAAHVLERLKPYLEENGGPIKVQEVCNVPGRSNLILEYPGNGKSEKSVAFVGSHFDVVHADPAKWDFGTLESFERRSIFHIQTLLLFYSKLLNVSLCPLLFPLSYSRSYIC